MTKFRNSPIAALTFLFDLQIENYRDETVPVASSPNSGPILIFKFWLVLKF